mmetsp:Transcript_147249/g.455484  ORF Transcript_147249/g.455484 Transcript_147249/m.455484 type:complete len:278 (-) Transcript_147249:96-929(-)
MPCGLLLVRAVLAGGFQEPLPILRVLLEFPPLGAKLLQEMPLPPVLSLVAPQAVLVIGLCNGIGDDRDVNALKCLLHLLDQGLEGPPAAAAVARRRPIALCPAGRHGDEVLLPHYQPLARRQLHGNLSCQHLGGIRGQDPHGLPVVDRLAHGVQVHLRAGLELAGVLSATCLADDLERWHGVVGGVLLPLRLLVRNLVDVVVAHPQEPAGLQELHRHPVLLDGCRVENDLRPLAVVLRAGEALQDHLVADDQPLVAAPAARPQARRGVVRVGILDPR